jgi:hypothetical protein
MGIAVQRFQYWVFTVAITIVSRLSISAGLLLRKHRVRIRKRGTFRVRTTFPSGNNVIDAKLVQPVGEAKGAVLICHGIGETVWHWKSVQRLLAQNGVASLLFNYSGWGRSTGFADVQRQAYVYSDGLIASICFFAMTRCFAGGQS